MFGEAAVELVEAAAPGDRIAAQLFAAQLGERVELTGPDAADRLRAWLEQRQDILLYR